MQDEFQGPGPEEMGLKPEDLSTEGTKPETPQNSDEELTGLARKVFKDEPGKFYPEEYFPEITREAKNILERYNFGPNLDDQFYGDIVRLAGEKVTGKITDIPSKLRTGYLDEEMLKEFQGQREDRENWWRETAYRLLRERQGVLDLYIT